MKINWKKLLFIIVITFIIGNFFSFFTMNNMDTFKELEKPISVPTLLFPIVWSFLYILMGISCYIICESNNDNIEKSLIAYIVQLLINSLWSLIFFGFEAYLLSFIWIIILFCSVIIMTINFYKVNKIASYLQIPYILWIIFAGYLNFGIYLLNR